MTALITLALALAPRAELEQHALTTAGSVDRGRAVYASEKMQCAICHKMDDDDLNASLRTGRGVGPDLTAIGNKFDRPHLVDSLLHPSREIGYGYQSLIVRLDDGRIVTGIEKERSADSVTLLDAKGERQAIATADIEQRDRIDRTLLLDAGDEIGRAHV